MPSTPDYEFLLECENVIGVDYDEDAEQLTVFVSQKRPKSALDAADDVETRLADAGDDVDVTVVDAGYDETREGFDAMDANTETETGPIEAVPEAAPGRQDRHRPVPGGVSEINANSTAATAGPYPARVDDPEASAARWREDVAAGDLVRLANNHTYARSNAAEFGELILQPSPQDGGTADNDAVGELVGYVPIEDDGRVDVAARSVDPTQETATYYELDEEWPTGVYRDDYADLRGETVTKTGRTSGVTSAELEATSASVRVDIGDQEPALFREQLVAGPLSEPGDSGSPVFLDDGALVGLLFAGSSQQTICNRIAAVETELGVEVLTAEPDEESESGTGPEPTASVPVYTTTMDHTIDVDLAVETPSPTLDSLSFDGKIRSGDSVDVTATITAAPGTYWLAIDGERTTVTVPETDRGEENETETAAATVTVSIPDEPDDSLSLRVRGGPIGSLDQ